MNYCFDWEMQNNIVLITGRSVIEMLWMLDYAFALPL